jgi:Fe-S cluster biogenesis protein NfuA
MLSTFGRSTASFSLTRFFAAGTKDVTARVEEVIASRIRPALKLDGGDVTIKSVKDGIVECVLTGQCRGCPARHETLRYGILETLQEEIPEIRDVREYKGK